MRRKFSAPAADPDAAKRAAMLADQADAETRRTGRVRLNYSRAGETLVVHFPDGTDLWKVLAACDRWVKG